MNKKVLSLSIIGVLLISLIGGASYAVWISNSTQEDENVAVSGCLNVEITNDSEALLVNTDYPQSDNYGMARDPYSFDITNTCSVDAEYKIMVEVQSDNTLAHDLIKVGLNNDISLLSELDNTDDNYYVMESGYITVGSTKEYEFRQWFDEAGTLDDSQDEVIKTKIVLESVATDVYNEELLAGNDPVLNTGFVPITIDSDRNY